MKLVVLWWLVLAATLWAQKAVLPIKIDDFQYPHSWWDYRSIGTVKLDKDAFRNGEGFLYFQLKDPDAGRMCDVGISERQGIYKKRLNWLEAEIRLKVLTPMKPGSRGWGFWRMRVAGRPSSLAWFMEQMGPFREPKLTWQKAGVISDKGRAETTIPLADNEWHTYRIVRDRKQRHTRFYVDGNLVLDAPYFPVEGLSFHCWIDNGVYTRQGVQFAGWKGLSALVIDYIKIKTTQNLSVPVVNEGPVIFYQQYAEFGNGSTRQHWKTIPFVSRGKKVWIFTTVRLEDYQQFAPADAVQLVVDNDPTPMLQAGGEEFRDRMASLAAQIAIPSGKHHLTLFATQTPFLRDVTILEPDTVLVHQRQFDARSKHRFVFSLEKEGNVVIYISGNARENPGWNHVQPESRDEAADGDVWFYLDGQKLSSAICGNRVFGNGGVLLIRKHLAEGTHTLEAHIEGNAEMYNLMIVR